MSGTRTTSGEFKARKGYYAASIEHRRDCDGVEDDEDSELRSGGIGTVGTRLNQLMMPRLRAHLSYMHVDADLPFLDYNL